MKKRILFCGNYPLPPQTWKYGDDIVLLDRIDRELWLRLIGDMVPEDVEPAIDEVGNHASEQCCAYVILPDNKPHLHAYFSYKYIRGLTLLYPAPDGTWFEV